MKPSALFFLFLPFLCHCSSTQLESKMDALVTEQEYSATFEETWRAVQQAIIAYPLRTNNMDVGQIQTTSLRAGQQFKKAEILQKKGQSTGGHRYTLNIQVIKVSPKRTKVSVEKDAVVYRDFISSPEDRRSDGLEEAVILYRVGREIDIERVLIRSAKKK